MKLGLRYIEVDQGMLAFALSTISNEIHLKDDILLKKTQDKWIEEKIVLDENIFFIIHLYQRQYKESDYFGGWNSQDGFLLKMSTYISGIEVNRYGLYLDLRFDDSLNRNWYLFEKEILHPIPNNIASYINDWSASIVKDYSPKELSKKSKYEMWKQYLQEEAIIKEVSENTKYDERGHKKIYIKKER